MSNLLNKKPNLDEISYIFKKISKSDQKICYFALSY